MSRYRGGPARGLVLAAVLSALLWAGLLWLAHLAGLL